MKHLPVIVLLLSVAAGTVLGQIRHIPLATPKQIPELTGTWVPDEKQNKKLLKKAESEMRKKMTARMPKPPEGGGGPPGGGGMPG
nr:hypothetical protein [Arenimonas sp.]